MSISPAYRRLLDAQKAVLDEALHEASRVIRNHLRDAAAFTLLNETRAYDNHDESDVWVADTATLSDGTTVELYANMDELPSGTLADDVAKGIGAIVDVLNELPEQLWPNGPINIDPDTFEARELTDEQLRAELATEFADVVFAAVGQRPTKIVLAVETDHPDPFFYVGHLEGIDRTLYEKALVAADEYRAEGSPLYDELDRRTTKTYGITLDVPQVEPSAPELSVEFTAQLLDPHTLVEVGDEVEYNGAGYLETLNDEQLVALVATEGFADPAIEDATIWSQYTNAQIAGLITAAEAAGLAIMSRFHAPDIHQWIATNRPHLNEQVAQVSPNPHGFLPHLRHRTQPELNRVQAAELLDDAHPTASDTASKVRRVYSSAAANTPDVKDLVVQLCNTLGAKRGLLTPIPGASAAVWTTRWGVMLHTGPASYLTGSKPKQDDSGERHADWSVLAGIDNVSEENRTLKTGLPSASADPWRIANGVLKTIEQDS